MNEEKCVMCFPPQYMNFVHSFESEITNYQSLRQFSFYGDIGVAD